MRLHTNSHGHTFHVGGRRRPKQARHTHPHLFKSLRGYVRTLPPAPDFDNTTDCQTALSMILANGPDPSAPPQVAVQGLGDCTSAGPGHIIDSITAGAGAPVVITAQQAITFYSLSTGYVLGQPSTDQGGDEVTVCQTWQQKGYDGRGTHAIAGWAALSDDDLADPAFIKSCAWLFPMMFGLELADPWLNIAGDGFVWDVGSLPDPNDGHCVVGLGGNAQGLKIDSWGFLGTITYAAIKQFCSSDAGGNLFAILSPEVVNKAKKLAPNGFDYDQLLADLQGLGGNAPAPAPAPAPTGPVTLAQAQSWVAAGIQQQDHELLTQADAIAAANAGLAAGWPQS